MPFLASRSVLTEDATVETLIMGTAVVAPGVRLELNGTVAGDLVIDAGGCAVVSGVVKGTIYNHGGVLELTGVADRVIDVAASAVSSIDPAAVVRNPVA